MVGGTGMVVVGEGQGYWEIAFFICNIVSVVPCPPLRGYWLVPALPLLIDFTRDYKSSRDNVVGEFARAASALEM